MTPVYMLSVATDHETPDIINVFNKVTLGLKSKLAVKRCRTLQHVIPDLHGHIPFYAGPYQLYSMLCIEVGLAMQGQRNPYQWHIYTRAYQGPGPG